MGGWYDLTGFSLEEMTFTASLPVTVSDNMSLLWLEHTRSRDPRRQAPRSIASSKDTAKPGPKGQFFVDYRLPAYTYDKLSCGLIDAHEYVRTRWRWTIHELTRAIVAYLPEKALSRAEIRSRPHKDTSYTLG